MNSIQSSFLKPHTFFLSNPPFVDSAPTQSSTTADARGVAINEKKIGEVWSKHNFEPNSKVKVENLAILNNIKTTWGVVSDEDKEQVHFDMGNEEVAKEMKLENPEEESPGSLDQEISPSHHARRPPNAFLIFCKKHRPIVRQRYPTTENRGVTKILGEWWALLNIAEKQPYNDLAKEYKDAFLSANPGFRWYKLPAPPLRTLATRPTTISKPVATTVTNNTSPIYSSELSEFTPGKLADESQLGGLTSLMNNNYNISEKIKDCCKVEDNNNESPINEDANKIEEMFSSPVNVSKPCVPPKPIKKRLYEQHQDEKSCARNIFEDKEGNITQQDLLNKVVDGIFAHDELEPKEQQRKSDRVCKGKRYERFMVEGKLLGNKKELKLTQHHKSSRMESKIEQELTMTKATYEPPSYNLENTIKRLAERTNVKLDCDDEVKSKDEPDNNQAKPSHVSFNLDLRIDNLLSLSYDDFVRRKRESKKRKLKIKSENSHNKLQKLDNNNVPSSKAMVAVGSKKRKNKLSITHLNLENEHKSESALDGDNALLGLATLAMVAASTEKITENVST
ncbi:HMG box transcription factor BBX isoform X1 [Euwallacea similis]|uniref:HMG box transcription factor BBX isoform X1 n=1 Tax=Euwallacea similis TaxID=1736056 RepID=UPI00344F906E